MVVVVICLILLVCCLYVVYVLIVLVYLFNLCCGCFVWLLICFVVVLYLVCWLAISCVVLIVWFGCGLFRFALMFSIASSGLGVICVCCVGYAVMIVSGGLCCWHLRVFGCFCWWGLCFMWVLWIVSMWWFGGCRFIVLAFCGCVVLGYLLDSGLGCCMACVCVLVCGWFWGGWCWFK